MSSEMIISRIIILLSLAGIAHGGLGYDSEDIQGVTVIRENFPTTQVNVEFGTGYNTVTLQRTYNSAVEVERVQLAKGGFISCNFKIKLCKSREEFFSSLSGGVSASGSYMGVEGSASVKFLTETKITSLDSILIASVDAITDTENVINARFSEEGQKLLDAEDYARFVETYGTHYLRKIIVGGKMMLVMKFSSSSKERKRELDTKLGASTGTFGAEAEFSAKMQEIRESSSLEVSIYASGSNTELPKQDIESCIQYAIDFAQSVLTYSAVREVEFAAVWTIPGTPDSFKRFLFPLQGKTDQIVHISVDLLNVVTSVVDMLALEESDLSYFTDEAWEIIQEIGRQANSLRIQVQNRFKTNAVSMFSEIIEEYKDKAKVMVQQIEELLEDQRHYRSSDSMFIKSAGTGKFISTPDGDYPRLDLRSPVPMNMVDINGGTQITIGGNHFVYLFSSHTPEKVLCMGKNNWFVFWISIRTMDRHKCQWRLAHTTDVSKRILDYGDRVILYNRYWPSYIMGVSDDGKWVGCRDDSEYQDKKHQWYIEKSN